MVLAAMRCTRPVSVLRNTMAIRSVSTDKWNSVVTHLYPQTPVPGPATFTVKDNILTIGKTTCASEVLADFESPLDATVVKLLVDSGYINIGKTNLDEFGMGSYNLHSAHGPALNPLYDEQYVTGGSSGGSAASVAAGLCTFSLGTDTGGSVRLPASNCGVIGFKPSYGRISRWGVIPYAQTLDTVGILAREISVVQQVFDVVDSYDSKDPTSLEPYVREQISEMAAKRNQNRRLFVVGIPEEFMLEELTAESRTMLQEVAGRLMDMGHQIVLVSIPSIETLLLAYYTIATAEAASNLSRYDGIRYGKTLDKDIGELVLANRSLFGEEVQRRIILGNYTISSDAGDHYAKATELRERLVQEFNLVFYLPNLLTGSGDLTGAENCDFLLAPTSITKPISIAEARQSESTNLLESYTNDILTTPMSLAGLPTISIPAGHAQGIQLVAQYGDDHSLLELTSELMNQKII